MKTNEWIIVTGATGGIGKAVTEKLAASGFPLVLACRNPEKAIPLQEYLHSIAPTIPIRFFPLDLESPVSIARFCRALQHERLSVKALINNAGVLSPRFRLSRTGFESNLTVNYLGTALLTLGLLPCLKKRGKIINFGSCTWRLGKVDRTFFLPVQTRYNRFRAYGTSKLALLLFTAELALHAEGISVAAIDPGVVDTGMIRMHSRIDPLADRLFRPFIRKPSYPAERVCRIINTDFLSPGYYRKGSKAGSLPAFVMNHSCRKWLWQETIKLKTALLDEAADTNHLPGQNE